MIRINKQTITPYLFIGPALLLMTFVVLYPLCKSAFMSLCDYNLFYPFDIKFIWLSNYIEILKDEIFWISLWNTIIWVGLGVFFQFFFGLLLALILNESFIGRGFIRSIILIPWVTPGVLIALMWTWMYNGNYGVINEILLRLGIIHDYIPWLARSATSLYAIVITIIWQGIPFFAIMILAGLQSIPKDLYDAAKVDGATSLKRFFYVTLPMLKSTILVTTLLRIIWVANSVDIIYTMTGGGPGYSSMTLSVYTFVKARSSLDFGYASALSIYLTFILTIIIFFYLRYQAKTSIGGKEEVR